MRSFGDIRSEAHSASAAQLMRLAARCGSVNQRVYIAGVARQRRMPAWVVDYCQTLNVWPLVDHAVWEGGGDPLDYLNPKRSGVLTFNGEEIWRVTDERALLAWSLAERWAALPAWEAWAREHAPEHLHAPRRAVEALEGWLRGSVSKEELDAARDAARGAAYAACANGAAAAAYAATYTAAGAARAAAYATADAADAAACGTYDDAYATVRARQRKSWTARALELGLTGRAW